jgi:hypothetical protein
MAFDHLRVVLADRLEKQLLCPNGEQRPKLDRKDCEFIVAFVLNEISRAGVAVDDLTSERGTNAYRC